MIQAAGAPGEVPPARGKRDTGEALRLLSQLCCLLCLKAPRPLPFPERQAHLGPDPPISLLLGWAVRRWLSVLLPAHGVWLHTDVLCLLSLFSAPGLP